MGEALGHSCHDHCYFSAISDDAAIHVAAKYVAGCQVPRCRCEKIADG